MTVELSYSTVSNVIDSWERVRKLKNYEEAFGVRLFAKFAKSVPEAMKLFGFTGDQSSDLFISQAKQLVRMLDSIINTLGPDLDMLTGILSEIGKKCITYHVEREYFPVMGIALFQTLKEFDDKFTKDIEISWLEVYDSISVDMIRVYDSNSNRDLPSINAQKAKRKETKKEMKKTKRTENK
jgi:hemoglobin-like flavoprotein